MAVAGKNGKVVIGSGGEEKVVGIKSWSLELSLETLETTALGDDWKNYIAGLKESGRLRVKATMKYLSIRQDNRLCRTHF